MAAPQSPGWQVAILKGVGAPVTAENLRYLNAWTRAEGGNAANNPFNTTEPGYNETGKYNSVGVRNYGNPQSGIAATIATLRNGHYANILSALHNGGSAMADAQALAASPWGTGSLVEKVLGGPVQQAPQGSVSPSHATAAPIDAGGSASRQRVANMLMSSPINFDSNQVQIPNLMALVQARQQASATPAPAATRAARAATGGKPPVGGFKPGVPVAGLTSEGGLHPTEGLDGYPAHDYFAPSGSRVVAPVGGKVVRLSGHDPSLGPIEGPHGPLGWSVYIQGSDGHTYYLTHMGSRNVQVGETLQAGQPIGTVADYAHYGTPSHIHMGVH